MTIEIGWVREDNAHDVLVKTLARRVALETFDWLDLETIDYQWHWSGPDGETEPKLTGKRRVLGPWFICGFEPRDSKEAAALQQLKVSLSFDPTTNPGRLTAKRDDVSSSAKRVINHLTAGDVERRNACLDHPLDVLIERGQGEVGLARFIADLRAQLPRHFAPAPRS